MQDLNPAIIATVANWLKAGQTVWLVTILASGGAPTRPAGSLMAVSQNGDRSGSVSADLIDDELVGYFLAQPQGGSGTWPKRQDYDTGAPEKIGMGPPCSSGVQLLIERHEPPSVSHFQELHARLNRRERLVRKVSLATGECSLEPVTAMAQVEVDDTALRHKLNPEFRLLIVGAGEVSRYVARFALANGFVITLCEPRAAYRAGWREAGLDIVSEAPEELINDHFNDLCSAIVTLAHDPALDDRVMLAALRSQAFYIGALGGARASALRRQRLHDQGLGPNQLSRLHAPIGFDIGSETPAEIAIAILAELLAERHRLLRRPVPL